MSLFPEFEIQHRVYNPVNDQDTATTVFEVTPLDVDLNIIRLSEMELNVETETVIDHEANPKGDWEGLIKKNARIEFWQGGEMRKRYKVVEPPYYMRLMKRTKLKLKLVT